MSSLRNVYDSVASPTSLFYSRRATDDGEFENPGNNFNMIGDYSGAVKRFWVTPDVDQRLDITSIQLLISDDGVLPNETDYGNIVTGLSEGLRFFAENNGVVRYANLRLKSNVDVLGFSDSFSLTSFGSNVRVISYRRFFSRDSDDYKLYAQAGGKFGVELNDNLSTLVKHALWVSGSQRLAQAATFVLAALLPLVQTGGMI